MCLAVVADSYSTYMLSEHCTAVNRVRGGMFLPVARRCVTSAWLHKMSSDYWLCGSRSSTCNMPAGSV